MIATLATRSSLNRTRVRRAANVGLPRFKCHSLRSLCHQRQPPGLRRPQEDPVSCQEIIGSRDICDHKARRFNATFVGHDSILRWGGYTGRNMALYIPRRAGHGTSPLHSPLCTRHEHHLCVLILVICSIPPPFPLVLRVHLFLSPTTTLASLHVHKSSRLANRTSTLLTP